METNTKNPEKSDRIISNSETKINEQISSIINKKFNESLEQIQNDPTRLAKTSFLLGLWRSLKQIVKEQLESISRGFYAAMIAIIVAILTPVIINSTVLSKLEAMNQQIESVIPTEEDKEVQNRIMEAIQVQTDFGKDVNVVENTQSAVQRELEKQFSENPLLLQSNADKRFESMESNISLMQEEILSLKEQKERLSRDLAELSRSGVNTSRFLKRLEGLKLHGEQLEHKISSNQHSKTDLEKWLKTVYFLTGSVPLRKQSSFDSVSLLEESMKNVVESKGGFREPKKQISETLVILDSIELLAVSGLIENRSYAGNH